MPHFFATISEMDGDMEYNTDVVFIAKNGMRYAERLAMTWRGTPDSLEDYVWWNGCSTICLEGCQEIPEEHFNILKIYISDLTEYVTRKMYKEALKSPHWRAYKKRIWETS